MPCYRPLTCWRSRTGRLPSGGWPVVFKAQDGIPSTKMSVPCGQCIGCRLEYSRQWAVRCMHERQMHDESCFLTLTYDQDNINDMASVYKRDVQLFIKRLRKRLTNGLGLKIRYFMCGEYGDRSSRPHYHGLLFGYNFPDKELFKRHDGIDYFTSKELDGLWSIEGKTIGFSLISEVTFESAAYVARYATKKITGERAKEYYDGKESEFALMSRNIGKEWLEKYKEDIYNYDSVVEEGGIKMRPPKAYDRMIDKMGEKFVERMKKIREKRISKVRKIDKVRLQDMEKCKRHNMKLQRRKYDEKVILGA